MAVLEARDNEGQVLYGASLHELAERTRNAGDRYTSWTVYEVAPTAAGAEPEKTYVGYMIDRQFVSLDELDAERQAEHEDQAVDPDYDGPVFVEMNAEPPHPPRTLADYMDEAAQGCPVPLPTVDELLADPEVAAEADRMLAGEGGTILGIPFAPSKSQTERGE